MIVKNESAVLQRCFESVRGLIDTWVIGDTGSSDGTPQLVRQLLADIPGTLYTTTWRDFGTNRSELLARARGVADYLLLLDADMTLTACGPLPELGADAYLLEHEGELSYAVPRLVRGDLPWRYVGATHEFLSCDEEFTPARLGALRVVHHGDGGARADKLTRDLALLHRQLRETPDDPRTLFYLAQTYRDLGDHERALALYGERAERGGFAEEAFYAAFQHAVLSADLDWPRGRELLADAWERRPERIEPLYEIAVRARNAGESEFADWATEIGFGRPLPEDILFVHRFAYDWGMSLERSLALAARGDVGAAAALTDELLAKDDLPERARVALSANRVWLTRQGAPADCRPGHLAPARLAELCRAVEFSALCLPGDLGAGAPVAASVAGGDEGLALLVSGSSADAPWLHGVPSAAHPAPVLLDLDHELAPTSTATIELATSDTGPSDTGPSDTGPIEREPIGTAATDLVLFTWRAGRWALDSAPAGTVIVALDGGPREPLTLAAGSDQSARRPHAVPFVRGDDLYLVDGLRPFRVQRVDEAHRQLVPHRSVATDCRFAGLRCASPGLSIDDGHLFVAEQEMFIGGRPFPVHRFVAVDGALVPSGISRPFTFLGGAGERCAGIARRGDQVVLSVSDGQRVVLVTVPLEAVISAIVPVESTP